VGFALVVSLGFKPLKERSAFFQQWIDEGHAGGHGMAGANRNGVSILRRLDTCLRPVESLAYPHTVPVPPDIDWPAELRGRIASYALGPDLSRQVLARTARGRGYALRATAGRRPRASTSIPVRCRERLGALRRSHKENS